MGKEEEDCDFDVLIMSKMGSWVMEIICIKASHNKVLAIKNITSRGCYHKNVGGTCVIGFEIKVYYGC